MKLDEALECVAVIGAGGKMGRGIALLMLLEMARQEVERQGKGQRRLWLIDSNEDSFAGLKRYLKNQLRRYAEKNIIKLRGWYEHNSLVVSNLDAVDAFLTSAMDMVVCDSDISRAKNATMVFEAALENIDVKTKIFSTLAAINSHGFFFTNTSSIPISLLNERCSLNNRIIGFHFFNPPAVQKLVEIIAPDNTAPGLVSLSQELLRLLKKVSVRSQDVAGFISNGHFMREIAFACDLVRRLSAFRPEHEAIYLVNTVTKEWLLRPMGIFQLVDYVGIDVCNHITTIMSRFNAVDPVCEVLLQEMLECGEIGGQDNQGFLRQGFFRYEGQKPIAVYSLQDGMYHNFDGMPWCKNCDAALGALPPSAASWDELHNVAGSSDRVKEYLKDLLDSPTVGAKLARTYLSHSRFISEKLVDSGVAASLDDIDIILKCGFYHLYGPTALDAFTAQQREQDGLRFGVGPSTSAGYEDEVVG